MNPLLVPLKICPVAPTGVSAYTDQISGMVLWSVLWLFGIAALVSVGAILVGRATHSPHLSKGGIIGLAGVLDLPVEGDARGVEDAPRRLRQLRPDAVAGDQGDRVGHGRHSSPGPPPGAAHRGQRPSRAADQGATGCQATGYVGPSVTSAA